VKTALNPEEPIDLTLSDDDDEDREFRLGSVRKVLNPDKETERELEPWQDRKPAAKNLASNQIKKEGKTSRMIDIDDEIEIVNEDEGLSTPLLAASKTNSKDADVELLGTRNEVILPHSRHDCLKNVFLLTKCSGPETGRAFRATCQNQKHCDKCYCYVCDCLASECKEWTKKEHCNATDERNYWVRKRQEYKNKNQAKPSLAVAAPELRGILTRPNRVLDYLREAARNTNSSIKCRKCGFEADFHYYHGDRKKCQKCGRVISERFMDKERSSKYTRIPNDLFLGERVFKFRISAPDLRSMHEYKDYWQEADPSSPASRYEESEIEEDIFRYHLGIRPDTESIMNLVSNKEKGRFENDAQEAVILENENDFFLIKFLDLSSSIGKGNYIDSRNGSIIGDNQIRGNIEASWNKEDRTGTFKFQLFLPSSTFSTGIPSRFEEGLTLLLGLWYGYFPLNLTDICGNLMADSSSVEYDYIDASVIAEEFAKNHNREVKALRKQLSLASSTGDPGLGGTSDNDQSLKGALKKFFRDAYERCTSQWRFDLQKVLDGVLSRDDDDLSDIEFILKYRDCAMLYRQIQIPRVDLTSVNGVMDHVENLGHEGVPYVEGLNIELLDFQKQSLQWCLERESVEGGIQTFFWPKLPYEEGVPELYYNPILQRFRRDPPRVVRGGFIADEMGLGKTISSLGLILKNPAPPFPANGSDVTSLSTIPDSQHSMVSWDKDLYAQTSTDESKRGSIVSQGTLVICPVSLVGQWIDEAKSKLKNPGLIYPYHGQTRVRDPDVLAQNAIVVTTYDVLASDDNHHRKKGGSSYCPPCETVRWWRIICDEGHHLRDSGTLRNRAISNLVADHKWLVSGTPVNTSLQDLKNQLKFIGMEDVDSYFSRFYSSYHGRRNQEISRPGHLIFMLRNIMMRHTQKQRYRNTKTTLMSLPVKTERSIEISLSKVEKQLYDALDNDARDFYINFKREHRSDISKHYLKLSQKLTPMRVACAGGPYPLMDDGTSEDTHEEVGEAESGKKKEKKIVAYSDVAFEAKFKVLISELKRSRDKDASSKSLVFSQYTSTLNWLQKELPKHGFQFRTLSGNMSMKDRAKALSDFQKDPPTTIFLLSMRAGNCGINLTQANRVFLMEPNFNPALEKQAIGRVHRLGQKRKVKVIRLLVKDTVETRINRFLQMKYGGKEVAKAEKGVNDAASKEVGLEMPVGNVSTERPKNKILTKEFDILFGVENHSSSEEKIDYLAECMPDNALSSGSI